MLWNDGGTRCVRTRAGFRMHRSTGKFERSLRGIQQKFRDLILQNPTVNDANRFVMELREARRDDHGKRRLSVAEPDVDDSVHARHPVIQKHQIKRLRAEELNAFFSGTPGDHVMPWADGESWKRRK